jgi:ketosteroid isomerase-like protein
MDRDAELNLVNAFNACINRRDIGGLARLMTEDHAFVDTGGNAVRGKDRCTAAWTSFFESFPDYRNVFEAIELDGRVAVIVGRSSCSDARLAGSALWCAKLEGMLIAEWRVYDDTPENRNSLGLQG